MTEIRTEDRQTVRPGDRAFNYYDRKPGTIQYDMDSAGWFTFVHDDGSSALLNGERICSEAFAIGRGWMVAFDDRDDYVAHACEWCGDDVDLITFDSPTEGRIRICRDGDACIVRYNDRHATRGEACDWGVG